VVKIDVTGVGNAASDLPSSRVDAGGPIGVHY
jgi:hypothetical protein